MKKRLAITLIVVLVLSMLIGCTTDTKDPVNPPDKDKVDETDKDKDVVDKDKPDKIEEDEITEFKDGSHEGKAKGYGGDIEVSVEVKDGKITSIEVAEHKETVGIGDKAPDEIADKIVEEQKLNVEVISGATVSSKGTIDAVKDALK